MVSLATELSVRAAIWLAARLCYRFRIEGSSRVPAQGAAILVCNHVSFLDWLFIQAAVGRPVRFVMDHAFVKGPLLKWTLTQVRVIPISDPREDRNKVTDAYARIHEELARGELVCIFPEGKITRDGKLGAFKPGVMKILKTSPVPVVPMGLEGLWGSVASFEGGPAFRKLPRRLWGKVTVRVGDPVPASEVTLAGIRERVASLSGG